MVPSKRTKIEIEDYINRPSENRHKIDGEIVDLIMPSRFPVQGAAL